MKKLLVLVPFLLISTGCAKEAAAPLEPLDPESVYTVKLEKENCNFNDDSPVQEITTNIATAEDENVSYSFIGYDCFIHDNYDEFAIKTNGYVKSNSSYKVERLRIDFVNKSGINFNVYNNLTGEGEALEYHESDVEPEYPGATDYGCVYEYEINGNDWYVKGVTNKSWIYSITVVFDK